MGTVFEALQKAEKEHEPIAAAPDAADIDEGSQEHRLEVKRDGALPCERTIFQPTIAQTHLDQYENIKSSLFARYPAEQLRTIVFTSTAYGEGASTTAVNFATALARDTWRSVLLIDADIRRPCLHKLFNINLQSGLSDILATDEDFQYPPNKILSNLYLHTSGLLGERAVGRFESRKFNTFLDMAQTHFDYVLFDCPPVFAFPETRIIAKKANGVVMVVSAGKTRQRVAIRAKEDIEAAGAKLFGIVLNKRRYYIPNWLYKRI